jgi:hypothetical protein
MNQKTNNAFTFNQVILNEAGNSYLCNGSKLVGHVKGQLVLNEILKTKAHNNNRYFVGEILGDEFNIIAAQGNSIGAKFYYNKGKNENRVIIHFDRHFL